MNFKVEKLIPDNQGRFVILKLSGAKNLYLKKSTVTQEINTPCDIYNLSDKWQSLNKDKQRLTWRTKSFKIQCRLDFFLVS